MNNWSFSYFIYIFPAKNIFDEIFFNLRQVFLLCGCFSIELIYPFSYFGFELFFEHIFIVKTDIFDVIVFSVIYYAWNILDENCEIVLTDIVLLQKIIEFVARYLVVYEVKHCNNAEK